MPIYINMFFLFRKINCQSSIIHFAEDSSSQIIVCVAYKGYCILSIFSRVSYFINAKTVRFLGVFG